jgi:Rrf2 family protein
MFTISKKADYGLLMVSYLSQNYSPTFVSLKYIADIQNIPYKFLSQIALELKNAHLLHSKEGIGGGYRLAKKPQDISIADVVKTLDGPIAPVGCLRGKQCQSFPHCCHRPIMQKVALDIESSLQNYSLKQLAAVK